MAQKRFIIRPALEGMSKHVDMVVLGPAPDDLAIETPSDRLVTVEYPDGEDVTSHLVEALNRRIRAPAGFTLIKPVNTGRRTLNHLVKFTWEEFGIDANNWRDQDKIKAAVIMSTPILKQASNDEIFGTARSRPVLLTKYLSGRNRDDEGEDHPGCRSYRGLRMRSGFVLKPASIHYSDFLENYKILEWDPEAASKIEDTKRTLKKVTHINWRKLPTCVNMNHLRSLNYACCNTLSAAWRKKYKFGINPYNTHRYKDALAEGAYKAYVAARDLASWKSFMKEFKTYNNWAEHLAELKGKIQKPKPFFRIHMLIWKIVNEL